MTSWLLTSAVACVFGGDGSFGHTIADSQGVVTERFDGRWKVGGRGPNHADIWASGQRLVVYGGKPQVYHYPMYPNARTAPKSYCNQSVHWVSVGEAPLKLCVKCEWRYPESYLAMLSENPF